MGARHERGALGEPGIGVRTAQSALFHRRDNGRAPGRERLDRLSRHAGDLEPPVRVGFFDPVAELPELAREFPAVERPDEHLRPVEFLVGHGAPLLVVSPDHVGNDGVGVKLGVEVAGGVMPERRRHHLLAPGTHHAARVRVAEAGFRDVLLDPAERTPDRLVVGRHDAFVAADQRGERDRFRGRQRDVAAGSVHHRAVLLFLPETMAGAAGHAAFEDFLERLGVHGPGQAQFGGAAARPAARLPVPGVVAGVIPVALVVRHALGGGGDGADGGDHVRSGGP